MKSFLSISVIIAFLMLVLAISGCGQSGPLYLPKDMLLQKEQITKKTDNQTRTPAFR